MCLNLSFNNRKGASLIAQSVESLPAMQEIWVRFLGWEDPLEKEWQPTLGFLPAECHGQRRLADYIYGVARVVLN